MTLERQALRALVRQFSRPFDCLRELVQNSLDAGAPRVDITLDAAADHDDQSVIRLIVDDRGEGMDEASIDRFLTTLFSSSKEGDLTRIGRYGVGFVSVFALDPEQVIVQTGRAGESWILRFDATWDFDKARATSPHVGTRITLLLRRPTASLPAFAAEVRASLRHWCEHAARPIWLCDRTSAAADPPDPFGPFRAEPPAELISRPLDLPDCAVVLRHEEPDLLVLIGAGDTPTFGLYRHGLTLARSDRPDLLGPDANRLRALSVKVDSVRLEHRLSRDHVVDDDGYRQVLDLVMRLADRIGEALLDRLAATTEAGSQTEALFRHLGHELRAAPPRIGAALATAARARPIWPTSEGPVCLDALADQERALGGVLVIGDSPALLRELHAHQLRPLLVGPGGRRLLDALPGPAALFGFARPHSTRALPAERAFVLLDPVPDDRMTSAERQAIAEAERALTRALGRPQRLRLADPHPETPHAGLVVPAPGGSPRPLGASCAGETVLLRSSPLVTAAAALTTFDEALAGAGLAHGVLIRDPASPPRALAILTGAASPP